jgi:phosphopantothenoylcysteine synthetase/decarboxylase
VCGGIAAYKAVEVCRRLIDAGSFVSPVMTRGATRFVGPVTFSALASEPVRSSLWDEPEPIPHTRLGQAADLVLVAPATARLIGSYAAGISSDLLTATLLATRAPVLICPAMHTEMWDPGVGFAHDTNAVLILGSDGRETEVPLASKADVARAVVDAIAQLWHHPIPMQEEQP